MKAIILTAGYGRRMQPITLTTHKALLKIGDRTLLQRTIDGLIQHNVTEFVIVVGFMADAIKSHLAEQYPKLRVQYVHNERFFETNNIISMSLALENTPIDQDILLIECDLVVDSAALSKLVQSPHPNVALVDRYRTGMDGTVVSLTDYVITDIITSQRQGPDFSFKDKFKTINMYKFSKEFCDGPFRRLLRYYSETSEHSYYEAVLGILIYMRHEAIHAEVLDAEQWIEIDTPNDLEVARFMFDADVQKPLLDRTFGGYWSYPIIDFCFIRNMYFPTGAIFSELKANLIECFHNYGSAQSILNLKLSYFVECRADRIVTLNGAAQAFPLIASMFKGRRVIIPTPSFGEYRRWFPAAQTYSDCSNIPSIWAEYEVVVVVNPNNPTGTVIPSRELYEWAQGHPDTTVIVDESFIEFSGHDSLVTMLEKTPLDNILVLKSLSKSLGIPGLRLGYLYTCNVVYWNGVMTQMPIWNLNSMAEYFVEIVLRHRSSLALSYINTIRDREQFASQLRTCDCVEMVYPSGANFILIKLKATPSETELWAKEVLRRYRIYIKMVTDKMGGTGAFIRLAVRLPHENQLVVTLLGQWCEFDSMAPADCVQTTTGS